MFNVKKLAFGAAMLAASAVCFAAGIFGVVVFSNAEKI